MTDFVRPGEGLRITPPEGPRGTLFNHVRKWFDRDYSPAYQDEYQRLWHQSAADAERLRNLAGALLQRQTARGLGRFFPDELPLMDELAKAVREKPDA